MLFNILISAMLAAAGQTPASPPRDVNPAAAGTGAISGTLVSDEAEARAVRRARITLRSSDGIVSLSALTDDRGRFGFEGLPAGRYIVSASKDGWIPTIYGAKRPLRPGSSLPLAPGEHARVAMRLLRGAVITGEVADPHGLPAAGATVRAMRYVLRRGERVLDFAGMAALADDRGVYRIYDLPPGDYVVGASWRPDYFGAAASELRLTSEIDLRAGSASTPAAAPQPDRTVALASTFYPGTTVTAQASLLSVGGGEERGGVDFTLQIVPTARLAGSVVAPDGQPLPAGVRVSLMSVSAVSFKQQAVDVFRETGVMPDGSFTFVDVAPGEYTVFARTVLPGAGVGQIVWASTDVLVDGDSLSGLDLALRPGTRLSGRVRFDGVARPVDVGGVRVALMPEQAHGRVSIAPVTAAVDADGHFTMDGVTPGRYRLTASLPGRPREWLLRSAVALGVETLDVPVAIAPGQDVTDAVIEFTDRMADLSGRLQDRAGVPTSEQTVLLFPRDPALWTPQSRRILTARPSIDGTFAFRALAPGEYLLTVVDDAEPEEWFDSSFLHRLVAGALPIAIAEGERKLQNVQVGG